MTEPTVSMRRLDASRAGFQKELAALLDRESAGDAAIEAAVQGILADVRTRGDAAVLAATARFDAVHAATIAELTISGAEIAAALQGIGATERAALQVAADRIRAFHERQRVPGLRYREADGTELGWQVTPLDRVGLYVPGGTAAYPSSVLMNAIPAKVAGVRELVMVSPTPRGERNALVLAAAAIAGVDTIYTIGGAQAVAALAYGTASIAPVDKIVGPGNAYVAEAKRRVFGKVGIDMIAGPSEVLVIGDGSTDADWVALDLFSQAEHDELAQAILICPDGAYLDRVEESMRRLIATMPRRSIIAASLSERGALIRSRDLSHACEIANFIAAEHLELSVADPEALLPLIRHAGAIFLGAHSSESLGDYCAGPNHVLPTSRTARFSSPLGVYDFQKRSSLIKVSRQGATVLGRVAATLAHGEGLTAHARAAEVRL